MKIAKEVLLTVLFFTAIFIIKGYANISEISSTKANGTLEPTIKQLNKNEMLVAFLPLTMGEATLIQLANNDFYLIDTGHLAAADELVNLLQNYGVKDIKGVFLSNYCEEYAGGLEVILANFSVETIFIPELISSEFKFAISKNTTLKTVKENDKIILYPEVYIIVLSPSEPLSLSPQNNSMVLQLINNKIQFLFTGNIDESIEKKLLEKYELQSEILKVSDFGSDFASSPEFLSEVDPHVGIIFTNDTNLYKTSDDVVERLNESWIDVYILKEHDNIIEIMSDGINYYIEEIKNKEEVSPE